jgi:hypothetical protein
MVWWVTALWVVAKVALSLAIAYALRPSTDTPDGRGPAGLDQFQVPTAQVGRAIPVLFGTKELKGPNVVWYGDFKTKPVKEKVDGGFLMGTKRVTVGYKYYLGIHMVLAHEIDAITAIFVDGTKELWAGSCTGGTITIDQEELFGGEKSDGGISGDVDVEMGLDTQTQNAYLVSAIGPNMPAFRGVCCIILKQVYLGTSPYLKNWSFFSRHIPSKWYSPRSLIGSDCNPAHIIYDVLTDKKWGMGYPEKDIDKDSFESAADILYNEGFGLSILWDHGSTVETFIREVLKHIDGSLYIDRQFGLFTLKLIRDDYDVESLPVFDESNIIKVERFRRRTTDDIINTVTVKFWDRENREDSSYTVYDTALIASMGGTVSEEIDYAGIANLELAAFVASRDLRAMSNPLADAVIYTNLDGSALNVGDAFVLSWPRYGVDESVMRVTAMDFSGLNDESGIRVECVEDVYGIDDAIYSDLPTSEWEDPIHEPANCPLRIMFEAPYHLLRTGLANADLGALPSDAGFACLSGSEPSSDAFDAQAWFNAGNGYGQIGTTSFMPYAILASGVGITDTSFNVSWDYDADVLIGSWGIIGAEVVRIDDIGTDTIGVGRGCLDTVPAAHDAGAILYMVSEDCAICGWQNTIGVTIYGKLLPTTSLGTLNIADAIENSITLAARPGRPYPPARLRINNNAGEIGAEIVGDILIEWRHRNRKQVEIDIYDTEDDVSVGPEEGTSYTVQINRHADGSLLYECTGIPDEELFVSWSDINYDGEIDIYLFSVRDGVESWQTQSRTVLYARAEYRETENGELRVIEDGTEYRIIETDGPVGNDNLTTPSIIIPAYGESVGKESVVMVATDLESAIPATHLATNWQISDDYFHSPAVWQSLSDESNLTNVVVQDGVLADDTIYYARVQYITDIGFTGWSTLQKFVTSAADVVPKFEKDALIAFFYATGGNQWTKPNHNWLSAKPVSEWLGVEIENGHVIGLDVSGFGLRGHAGNTLDPIAATFRKIVTSDAFYTGINFENLVNLEELHMYYASIITEFYLTNCPESLTKLSLTWAHLITQLDASPAVNLKELNLFHNNNMTALNMDGLLLTVLIARDCFLSVIDTAGMPLTYLDVAGNPITSIDLGVGLLEYFSCAPAGTAQPQHCCNIQHGFDLSGQTQLRYFNCNAGVAQTQTIPTITGTEDCYNIVSFYAGACGLTNVDDVLCGLRTALSSGNRNWSQNPTIDMIEISGLRNATASESAIACAEQLKQIYYNRTRLVLPLYYIS